MKNTILTLILALMVFSQSKAQKIEVIEVFGGYIYLQDSTFMVMNDLVDVMQSNTRANSLIRQATTMRGFAMAVTYAGGVFLGFPIGSYLVGRNPNWTLAGIGVGVIALSIPFYSSSYSKARRAVELYNDSLNSTSSYLFKPSFSLISNGSGIGFSMRF